MENDFEKYPGALCRQNNSIYDSNKINYNII